MRLSDLEGKRIGIWGAGMETSSLLSWLDAKGLGYELEGCSIDQPRGTELEAAMAERCEMIAPADVPERFARCDVIVRGPGIQLSRDEAVALSGVTPITTMTSLWISEFPQLMSVGVTGTKGKSTTTKMVAHALEAAGQRTQVAGNIGRPLAEIVEPDPDEIHVIELSSQQIADLEHGTTVAVFTNLYSDHINWHRTVANYHRDKSRLAQLPGVEHVVTWSADPVARAIDLPDGVVRHEYDEDSFAVGELKAPGPHNVRNACAALTAAAALGLEVDPESLADFEPLPDRLQLVAESDGILWVNDVLSSTCESSIAAVEAFPAERSILLIGGFDHEPEFDVLIQYAAAREDLTIVAMEDSGLRFIEEASGRIPPERLLRAEDLEASFELALRIARENEGTASVVFSPICPRAVRFTPATLRGDEFADLVAERAVGAARP